MDKSDSTNQAQMSPVSDVSQIESFPIKINISNNPSQISGASTYSARSFQLMSDNRDSIIGNDNFSEGEQKFIDNVMKCCESESGFDLYQLMAFYGNSSTRKSHRELITYGFNIIKTILCALTQLFGVIVIWTDLLFPTENDKTSWCYPPTFKNKSYGEIWSESQLKLLAFLFSSFLAYFSIDQLMAVEHGMHHKMKHAINIKWINVMWLRLGFTVNIFVSIVAVHGSFLVIYFRDNASDMILSSVALFFILQLDNLLAKASHYKKISKYVQNFIPHGRSVTK